MNLMSLGDNYLTLLFLIVFIVLIVQLLINYLSSKRSSTTVDMPVKLVSVIKCINNDYTVEREFREGDFIGKIESTCPKCGADLIIERIYAIPARSSKSLKKRL